MKPVFIYGPPASGKLTVAKELAKLTSFKIFDEHLLIDTAERFFLFKSKQFIKLHHEMRDLIFGLILKNKTNTIITYCPSYSKYNNYWKKALKKVKNVCLVRLECIDDVLFNRVEHEGRKQYTKAKTRKAVKQMLDAHRTDYAEAFGEKGVYVINNSHLSAKKVALMIKKHYKL